MNSSIDLSIILPVFNSDQTLIKCIDSIISQTMSDFELIIVNDGSTDNSREICEHYLEKDNRIKLINQENGGVSSARNKGLKEAIGKYICFVDSDDWVEQNYIAAFLDNNKNPEKEMIIQNCFEISVNGCNLKCVLPDKVYYKEQFSEFFSELHILGYGYPFAKLYETDIIKSNNLKFNENINFAEDLIFFLEYFQYVDSVRCISKAYYNYVQSDNTLSYSHNIYEKEIEAYYVERNILEKLAKQYKFNTEAIHYCKMHSGFILYRALRTIYRPEWKKNFTKRMSILREQATPENLYSLKAFSNEQLGEKLNKISVQLYVNKHFFSYDLYTRFFIFIRYQMSFLWRLFRKIVKPNKYKSGILSNK